MKKQDRVKNCFEIRDTMKGLRMKKMLLLALVVGSVQAASQGRSDGDVVVLTPPGSLPSYSPDPDHQLLRQDADLLRRVAEKQIVKDNLGKKRRRIDEVRYDSDDDDGAGAVL